MMKLVILLIPTFFFNAFAAELTVVHYNIKELDSVKISEARNEENEQLNFATKILRRFKADILSLNEMQYDLPGVPNKNFQTEGKNIGRMDALIYRNKARRFYTFDEANTGKLSRPENGEYIRYPNSDQRRRLADTVNFGMFPGQYSTGGIFKYPIVAKKVFSKLKWRDFNPSIDLTSYTDANGKPLPRDMELFDKNFTDVTLNINGKEVHVILLHTVPAFGFGNNRTPNFKRNADQLLFLYWYLTGKSPYSTGNLSIDPLKKDTTFIAMGDWNVDPNDKKPGAKVLRLLAKDFNYWLQGHNLTYIGQSFAPGGLQSQLDYILLSKDIKILDSGVYHPPAWREELGCYQETKNFASTEKKITVHYRKGGKNCYVRVNRSYYAVKKGSDHLPIWARIEL